ncbi:1-(5-phosphoribosyl)-5-[(5-phosphoribosylamino)methylideneamino]imidazole-4-carboxamide isomerase [Hirschia litorea]|uniref:1-(5-phosphoribosyl)-5-[(5-phosphoribosylamino)methylideneamino] imidazole-4-carboxamide isomerase n=1 Tax=Hirschia litorea TaxID=1199156 RepID=A0ABW2IMI4_9PROT
MELFPAIDLKDGACVRLIKGDMKQSTQFNDDPADQAAKFAAMGFGNLHVVDLNGAFDGRSTNEEAVKAILSATQVPVQLGGGIRDIAGIERWLKAGISRVILGTAAVRDPEFVKTAAKAFPNQVAVGIDAIGGMVAVEGWAETTDMAAVDLARKFEDSGVCAIIATDIGRDGTKTGVNVEFTGQLADAVNIPIIASGGVRDVKDITLLRTRTGANSVYGTILGRALYDGDIIPEEAVKAAKD